MAIPKPRLFSTLAAMVVAAACATLVGYWLARLIAVRTSERRLDGYAGRIFAEDESVSADVRKVLAAVDASRYRSCSDAEIGYFRRLILASETLKDTGRMRNGRIECSAALGRATPPGEQSAPDFTLQDGSNLYRDLEPYKRNSLTTIALQRGDSFAVYTPLTRLHVEPPPMHFAETATDAPTRTQGMLLGESLPAGVPVLLADGDGRHGDNLYATRCSARFFNCVTVYTSIPEVMAADRLRFLGLIGMFRVLGGLTGLGLSLLYFRYESLEHQLRRAIRRDELCLVYQPIVQLASGRIRGAEALARWTDKSGTAIGPDVFVKIAERQGFVGEITKLSVRRALREFGETLRSHPGFRLSINVAGADLADPGFLAMLDAACDRAAVPARSLAVEIVESSTVLREGSIESIRGLRARGYSVHIDDFGTGYSSLSYLQELAVDAIKIDKTFTHAISNGSLIVAIVPQILAMAEILDLEVIVEGVETEEQAEYFRNCARPLLAQGWYFGHPVPAAEFRCMLAEDERKAQQLVCEA